MHQKIELPPFGLEGGEHGVDRRFVLNVARQQQFCPDFLGQRPDAPAEGLALIGEGQFGTGGGKSFGDTPGDGMVVGDAHNEAALAGHESNHNLTSR